MTDDMREAIQTYRRRDGKINVTAAVADDLAYILGKHYLESSSHATYNPEKWKTTIVNLVRKLEIAVKRNVFTDDIHRQDIDRRLQLIKKGLKGYPESEPQVLVNLIILAFYLLGDRPQNKTKHHTLESDFDLSRFREVRYLQTPRQKARLIVEAARRGKFKEAFSGTDIEAQFYSDCGQDPEKFLDWFKTMYPKIYASIF